MADNYNSSTKNALNTPATNRSTTGDVVGETTGGLAGAATGAALGSLGGPLGTIIGGIAGAASGWWTGRQVSEAASSFDNDDSYYQNHYNSKSGMSSTSGMSGSSSAASSNYDTARPAYQLGHVAGMNPDYANRSYNEVEPDLRRGYESYASSNTNAPRYDDVRGHIADAYNRGQERRLTLSEEQLAVGKRQVQAGEVNLRKAVDTQHVQETVGLVRDEVSIERRPLSGADAGNLTIGEETIRVPLTREEAVVEKRVVGTEEVIVNTKQVTDNQTVEADLRKERLVTEGVEGTTTGTAGTMNAGTMNTSGTTRSGETLVDKAKDAARDLKNDVTGR